MSKRQTQAEANYGRGNPLQHCGICKFYQGHQRCNQVMGDISPFGHSDVFRPQENPFGATLSPAENAAILRMSADAQDRSGEVPGGGGAMPPGAPQPPQPPQPPQNV